jgi:hypothetical protein
LFRDEDFFRSYLSTSLFALHMLEAAKSAGADVLCLGDSSGAGSPQLVREISLRCASDSKVFLGSAPTTMRTWLWPIA